MDSVAELQDCWFAEDSPGSDNSRLLTPPGNLPNVISKIKQPPQFLINSIDWWKITPIIISITDIKSDDLKAKMSTDGNISLSIPNVNMFRHIQKLLIEHKTLFTF